MISKKINDKSLKVKKGKKVKTKVQVVEAQVEPVVKAQVEPVVEAKVEPIIESLNLNSKINLKDLIEQSKEHINSLKDMNKLLNTLEKVYNRNLKQITKKSKKNRRRIENLNRQPSGFAKPIRISDKLCKFYGVKSGTLVSRTDITRAITKHIRINDLQVKDNRRQFIPDKKLKCILSPLDTVKKDKNGLTDKQKGYTYFNVQKYISNEFIKA